MTDRLAKLGRRTAFAALLASLLPTPALAYNLKTPIDVTGAGAHVIVAGVAGKNTRVHGFDLSLSGASTVQWKCGSTNVTGVMTLDAYTKAPSDEAHFACAAGEDLSVTLGGAVQAAGILYYRQD
jgi:hypothetical protein